MVLDALNLDLDGVTTPATVTVRFYDFGAVAIAVRIAATDMRWPDFVDAVQAVDRAIWSACGRAGMPFSIRTRRERVALHQAVGNGDRRRLSPGRSP